MPAPWSDEEVKLAIEDYFSMLREELRGEDYNKAGHRRQLISRLHDRNNGSVERKHQNISAVLIELGLPYIDGYKPLGNYQRLLREVVVEHIERHQELLRGFSVLSDGSSLPPPSIPDIGSVLVEPPEWLPGKAPAPAALPRIVRNFDFPGQDARNRMLGRNGEKFVLEFEGARLAKAGRSDLVKKIEWVSEKQGDGMGFDIASFDEDGRERVTPLTSSGSATPPHRLSRHCDRKVRTILSAGCGSGNLPDGTLGRRVPRSRFCPSRHRKTLTMLYRLAKTEQTFDSIDPLPFSGLPLEKELEDLLAQNLWDVLFEGRRLMPIRQERAWQPEADIYAINEQGDLVIFELKRAHADGGAVHQALRYCERAGRYTYDKLTEMLREYRKGSSVSLQAEHQQAFDLEHPLDRSAFNKRQHLLVIGSAGDDNLIRNIDYWKAKGLSIDFIPYRVYQINGKYYFEFFSLPYDQHSNPAHAKGVIFDTNLSYDEDAIWYMCEKNRVAAFGGIKGIVHSFNKGDIVFLYHKGCGIVAAGEVRSDVKEDTDADGMFRDLKWLTPKPAKGEPLKCMPVGKIREVTGCNFFWAKTMKPPFLNREESNTLLAALKVVLA